MLKVISKVPKETTVAVKKNGVRVLLSVMFGIAQSALQ